MVAWTNLSGFGVGRYPLTYDDIGIVRLAVAAVGVALAWIGLGFGIVRTDRTVLTHPVWAVSAALALWAAVSAISSDQGRIVWLGQSERLEGVVTIALYALLLGAGLQIGRERAWTERVGTALVVGASLLSLLGMAQVAGLDRTNYELANYGFSTRNAFASTGNPNFLGGVLVLGLPVAAALALASKGVRRAAFAASGLLMLVTLYFTKSQGAWMAFVVEAGIVVTLWLVTGTTVEAARRRTVALTGVSVVAVGLLVIIVVSLLVGGLGPSLAQSGAGRFELQRIALAAAAERPLFGYGPDTYLAAFRIHRTEAYVQANGEGSTNNNAHSWVAQYAATLGFPGAFLLATVLVWGLWSARPRGFMQPDAYTIVRAGAWAGLVGFVVHLQFNVAILAATVPFWLVLGTLLSSQAAEKPVTRAAGIVVIASAAVLLVVAVVASATLISADHIYLRSRLAYNGLGEGDPIALAQRATRLNPLSVKYARGLAQARSKTVYDAIGVRVDATTVKELFEDARAAYRATALRAPYDYSAGAWRAALEVEVGLYLEDPKLLQDAVSTARRAASVDRVHWEVAPIVVGDTSADAVSAARLAPGLP